METTKTNKEDYIIEGFRIFDSLSYKEFHEKNELGYTPYYFDDKDYVLSELKLDSNFNPLKKNGKRFGCPKSHNNHRGNPILNWKEINNTKPSGFGITRSLQ